MKKVIKQSFLSSLGAAAWIAIVATFMQNANGWFGTEDTIITIVAVLILFSLSALIVGGFLIGKPIMLYIDGKKTDAVKTLAANAGWMLIFFIIAIIILAIIK